MPTVLLIDNCAATLHTNGGFLRLAGIDLATARTAAEGTALARVTRLDLILTEMRLADGSGLDVVRIVKAHEPGVPVIIVTAFPDLDSAFQAAYLGAAGYVAGPLRGDDLLGVVRQGLHGLYPVCQPQCDLEHHPIDEVAATDSRVRRVAQMIDLDPARRWKVPELADAVGLSESRLRHRFAAAFNLSVSRFIANRRLDKLAHLLTCSREGFETLADRAGLGADSGRARRAFRARFGLPPKLYRERHSQTQPSI